MAAFSNYRGYLSILVAQTPEQAALLSEIRAGLEKWVAISSAPEMEAKRAGRDLPTSAIPRNGEKLMSRDPAERSPPSSRSEIDVYEARALSAQTSARHQDQRPRATLPSRRRSPRRLEYLQLRPRAPAARQTRRRRKRRIKSIIQNILDGMITVDEKGVICSMNPAAEKMFGCIGQRDDRAQIHQAGAATSYDARARRHSRPLRVGMISRSRTGGTAIAVGAPAVRPLSRSKFPSAK